MAIFGPTTDHQQIRQWAESHGGLPAELLPYRVNHAPLELRLYFGPDLSSDKWMRAMTWDDFFARFDLMGLTFVYDDNPSRRPHESYEILQEEARSPYGFNQRRA
jgi:hypothetical protein